MRYICPENENHTLKITKNGEFYLIYCVECGKYIEGKIKDDTEVKVE